MTTPFIILCPGQGAQAVGMSKAWAAASTDAKQVFEEADAVLGDSLGKPLSTLCFEGPADELNRTNISQPALFTAAVAAFRGWTQTESLQLSSLMAAAGLSLGEYTALHLAGAFSFADGLHLVATRGRAMQDAADANPSSMVALIGADEDKANQVCDKARESDTLVPANFNAPGQVVISGSIPACDRAETIAAEMGLRATRLSVAGAFHSPLMASAADELAKALEGTTIASPTCLVMSNVTAEPHTSPDGIRRGLIAQLTSPVRWADCCQYLIDHNPAAEFHELAPGKALAGMMRRINRDTKVTNHSEP